MPKQKPIEKLQHVKYWWQHERKEIHKAVFKTAHSICQQQALLREQIVDYLEMYANGNVSGLGIDSSPLYDKWRRYYYRSTSGAPRFNVVSAIVDTVTSMVAYSPPIPQYITVGGDYGLQRKAKKRTRVLQGQMHHLGVPLCRRMFHDGAKTGTGIIWGEIGEDGLPLLSRLSTLELLVEHNDGFYMHPRSIHRARSMVSKEWLASRYPDFAAEIMNSHVDTPRNRLLRFTADGRTKASELNWGMCEVIESIHLPAGKNKGLRTLCVSEVCLEFDEWDKPFFPCAIFRYRERDYGFYGAGLIESAYESQLRIDELCERNARSQNLGSTMKMFNFNGQGTIKKSELTNEVGEVWDVNGTQPLQVVTFQGTLVDLQEQIDLEMSRLMFVEGVSQSQAAGDGSSQGLTSGVAIRAEEDTRAARMARPYDAYQGACLDVARLIERLNDMIAEGKPSYAPAARVRSGRKTFLVTSRWKDTMIPEGQVQIEMFPMSALPQSPAGKFAAVMEWIQGGFADLPYGMQILEFPDIDSYADVRLAYVDLVQWQIDQIQENGLQAFPRALPVPRQDYDIAIDLGQRALAQLRTMNADDPTLQAMDQYVTYAEDLKKKAIDAAQQIAQQEAAKQAALQPQQPVRGAGGNPQALANQAPARPGPGPQLVSGPPTQQASNG